MNLVQIGRTGIDFGELRRRIQRCVPEERVRLINRQILQAVERVAPRREVLLDERPLQRRLRDIHALTQHASVQESVFATAGAERLGRSGPFGV